MKRIRLSLPLDINLQLEKSYFDFPDTDPHSKVEIGYWDEDPDYYSSTLRDIAIVIYQMVGQGVIWQLADEMAFQYGLDPYLVNDFLFDLFEKYSELSELEAEKKEADAWGRYLQNRKDE